MKEPKYTAKVYIGSGEIIDNSGDEIEELYEWMLEQAQGKFGDLHGELIENKTNKIVRQFRKAPPD